MSGKLLVLKDEKLSLKADEPQVGQRHEDIERKWGKNKYILVFAERIKMMALPEVFRMC